MSCLKGLIGEIKKKNDQLKDRDLLGVNGIIYDVTCYVKYHPGGDVIKKFIDKDSTIVFQAFNHKPSLLEKLPQCGTYKVELNPIDKDFLELGEKFEKMGLKNGSMTFFLSRFVMILAFLATVIHLFSYYENIIIHTFASFILFLVWQQAGFIMHDTMHSHMFHFPKYDEIVGIFFSVCIFGINGLWWKEDHNTHHALTGVIDVGEKWMDPQLIEGIWVQNEKMFSFFTDSIHKYLIKFQAFIFVPVNVILGRYGIMIDSFFVGDYKKARTPIMYFAWFLHWCYIFFIFSFLPTWERRVFIYITTGCFQGILHLQLLVSHYCKEMLYRQEYDKTSWFKYMIDNNLNIDCHPIFDWIHGGLHLHIEHHTYPSIPRHSYRQMQPYIQELCKKHNIEYEYLGWFEAIWKTLKHLNKISTKYLTERSERIEREKKNCDKNE